MFPSEEGNFGALPDVWASAISKDLPDPVCSPTIQPHGFTSGSCSSTELGKQQGSMSRRVLTVLWGRQAST